MRLGLVILKRLDDRRLSTSGGTLLSHLFSNHSEYTDIVINTTSAAANGLVYSSAMPASGRDAESSHRLHLSGV